MAAPPRQPEPRPGRRRRDARRLAALLRAVTAPTTDAAAIAAVLAGGAPAALVEAVTRHGVVGYAWRALRDQPGLERGVRQELEARYYDGIASHLRALIAVGDVGRALDGAGIPWVVVKGPVLAARIHASFDLRFYGDVDVLVGPADLERALAALTAAGGTVLDRNWSLLCREEPGEVHVRTAEGATIDLHWHLLTERRPRAAFRLDTDELLDRAVTVDLGGVRAPTLCPEDTILHLAAHTVLSGGDRLMWHLDLGRALGQLEIDDERLAARARAAGLHHVLDVALTVAAAFAPADRVAAVRGHLAASRLWRRATAIALCAQPAASRRPGDPATARLLLRATRADLAGSLREAGRRGAERLLRADHRTEDGLVDPDGPAGMRHASGGPPARRAFFAAVAAHGRRRFPVADAGGAAGAEAAGGARLDSSNSTSPAA